MSVADLVFGVGHKVDADGHPIERGFGNLTDRAKQSAPAVAAAPEPAPVVATTPAVIPEAAVPAAPVETVAEKVEHVLHDMAHVIETELAKL